MGYVLFGQERPGLKSADIQKEFQALSEEEKRERLDAAAKLASQYKDDLATWKQSAAGKSYQRMCEAHIKKARLLVAKKRLLKDEPKKPQPAFMIFSSQRRAKLQEEDPSLNIGAIAKKLGEEWSNLSGEAKQEILDEEAKQKEEYEKAMAAFKNTAVYRNFDALQKRMIGKGSAGGVPPPASMPKKPPNVYTAFGQERPGLKIGDLHKEFQSLPEEERKERQEAAARLMEEYEEEMTKWRSSADGKKYQKLCDV